MKKISRQLFIILIMLLIIIWVIMPNLSYTYASSRTTGNETDEEIVLTISELFKKAKEFTEKGDPIENTISVPQLKETSNYIFQILSVLAIITAVIVGIVLGIQFLLASAEGKAEIKEKLSAYIVGCVIVFAPFTIWKTATAIGENIFGREHNNISHQAGIGRDEAQNINNIGEYLAFYERYLNVYSGGTFVSIIPAETTDDLYNELIHYRSRYYMTIGGAGESLPAILSHAPSENNSIQNYFVEKIREDYPNETQEMERGRIINGLKKLMKTQAHYESVGVNANPTIVKFRPYYNSDFPMQYITDDSLIEIYSDWLGRDSHQKEMYEAEASKVYQEGVNRNLDWFTGEHGHFE